MPETLPDLEALIEPLIGLPYEQFNCWQLARRLYRDGWGEELDEQPVEAWKHVQEIWWHEEPGDPLLLTQPWDLWILRGLGMASTHVGIVTNQVYMTHARKRLGLCLEPLRRWTPRLLQIARLRRLA